MLLEYSLYFAKIAYERLSNEPENVRSVSSCKENHSCNVFVPSSVFLTVFCSFEEIIFSLAFFEVLSERNRISDLRNL